MDRRIGDYDDADEIQVVSSVFRRAGLDCAESINVALPTVNSEVDVLAVGKNVILLVQCVGQDDFGPKAREWAPIFSSIVGGFDQVLVQLRGQNRTFYDRNRTALQSQQRIIRKLLVTLNKETRAGVDRAHSRFCSDNDITILTYEEMYYYDVVSDCTYDHCMFEMFNALGIARSLVQAGESGGSPRTAPSYLAYGKQIGPGLYLLNFVLGVDFLLQTSSLKRLRDSSSEQGYQRLLDKDKLRNMRGYLLDGVPAYPNNIICKLSEGTVVEPVHNRLEVNLDAAQSVYSGLLTSDIRDKAFIVRLPDSYDIFEVVDGQHRLFSFAQSKYHIFEAVPANQRRRLRQGDERIRELARTSVLLVTAIYVEPGSQRQDWADSGRLFYELNTTQTKLAPEDVIDLIEKLEPRNPTARANRLLIRLNGTGVLAKKIRIKPWQSDLIKRTSLIKYSGLEPIFSEGKVSYQILHGSFASQQVIASYDDYCYILIENYLAAYEALLRRKFGVRYYPRVEKDLTLEHHYAYSAVFIAAMIRLLRHFFSNSDRAFRARSRVNSFLLRGTNERNTTNINIRNARIIQFFSTGLRPIVDSFRFTKSEFDGKRGWGPNRWAKIEADLFYLVADARARRFGRESLIAPKYRR